MEDWELLLKGIVKTFEDFVQKMVEKGKEVTPSDAPLAPSAPKPIARPSKKRSLPRKELGDLEDKIAESIGQFPNGCTLKEIANVMDMQWHYLRIPLRQMVMDNKIIKDGKSYKLPRKKEAPQMMERDGVRRRIVDAKKLEQTVKEVPPKSKITMSAREKEILRFKILTAFRGRPEGLTLSELAAVLGRSVEGLDIIVDELILETKVVKGKGNKFHLS